VNTGSATKKTAKKHPLISAHFPVRVLRNESAKSCTGNWILCRNFAAAHRFRGQHRRKRPRSLEIYGPLVNETAKALKQQRELASEHSLHSIFPHTAHQTLGAHLFSFSPHPHTDTHKSARSEFIFIFPSRNPFIYVIATCCIGAHTRWK
jgi:hypothetical protein